MKRSPRALSCHAGESQQRMTYVLLCSAKRESASASVKGRSRKRAVRSDGVARVMDPILRHRYAVFDWADRPIRTSGEPRTVEQEPTA
ncbi:MULTISPECIES: hypothetical protein [unclassified Streptomyces]|uniref:hypothetical protein n=1 Tax=unclassified Streptomyces TaxID=2593676 RepID=UPI00278C657D|nr:MULTISPECIES: hypothetical protein [unclassified Streptomyces]